MSLPNFSSPATAAAGHRGPPVFRRALADYLLNAPMTVAEIAREAGVPMKAVADDLAHLARSLRHRHVFRSNSFAARVLLGSQNLIFSIAEQPFGIVVRIEVRNGILIPAGNGVSHRLKDHAAA